MASSNGINYRETYFEYPELTKIHGEPNSESLFKLRNELKANAQSVYSNLSDGTHGHLALVLNDAQYALLTNAPFDLPVHPGTLLIPDGTTGPMIAALKEAHHEQLRLFKEVQGVEKALIQQIVKAVDAPYLTAIRDRASNSLRGPIRSILQHLQTLYGRVSQQMLENREQELRDMHYNAKYPIDIVFNTVEDFVDYAELAEQPVTQRQTIARAYTILNKTRRFKQAITEWNRLTDLQKTWIAFKTHFRQAHQELRETTDVTLEDSALEANNANLVQQVVEGLQTALAPAGDPSPEPDTSAMLEQMANSAARTSESQQDLAAQLAQMQHAMANLQSQVQTQGQQGYPGPQQYHQGHQYQQGQYFPPPFQHGGRGTGRGSFGRGGRGRGAGRFGERGRGNHFRRRNVTEYCWTHGGCGHSSTNCRERLQGHQDASTFSNKLGGSTSHCD
jgi:hypothetical protein